MGKLAKRQLSAGSPVATRSFGFGRPGDQPFFGRWDGFSASSAPGVVRGATWYLRRSQSSGPADITFTFNAAGTPTVYNLLGQPTAVATFSAGTWSVRTEQTSGGADFTVHWGQAGEAPLVGGFYVAAPDCTSPSVAVVRGNVWHIDGNAPNQETAFSYGRTGDRFLSQHYCVA